MTKLTIEQMKNVQIGEEYVISNKRNSITGELNVGFEKPIRMRIVGLYDRSGSDGDYGFDISPVDEASYTGFFDPHTVGHSAVVSGEIVLESVEE